MGTSAGSRERDPYTGLTSGGTYGLLKKAGREIKTCSLLSPGEKRGTRLIFLPSVHEYFLKLAELQAAELTKDSAPITTPNGGEA